MIGRLLELFEGPEAPGPWSPPAMPAALHSLLPWRAWDESSELYVNAGSVGFAIELPPFAGIDGETQRAMTARAMARRGRAGRLLGWTLTAAVCAFLMWIVFGGAAHAEDPKAAARAIGNAGNTAARTIARDSSNAAEVPGYAGTNLTERNIGANALESRGRARLADPDDPGGEAGRMVVRGTTSRPPENVPAGDPMVRRSETIAASPQSAAHDADGLASGSTADCGADLQDADDGGSCGRVRGMRDGSVARMNSTVPGHSTSTSGA